MGCNGHLVPLKVLRGVMRVGEGDDDDDERSDAPYWAALRGELMALDQKAFMTSSSVRPFTRTDTSSIAACRAFCAARHAAVSSMCCGPRLLSRQRDARSFRKRGLRRQILAPSDRYEADTPLIEPNSALLWSRPYQNDACNQCVRFQSGPRFALVRRT